MGGDEHAARPLQTAPDVRDEVERGRVGPMKILDHRNGRRVFVAAGVKECAEQAVTIPALGELRQIPAGTSGHVEHRTEGAGGLQRIALSPEGAEHSVGERETTVTSDVLPTPASPEITTSRPSPARADRRRSSRTQAAPAPAREVGSASPDGRPGEAELFDPPRRFFAPAAHTELGQHRRDVVVHGLRRDEQAAAAISSLVRCSARQHATSTSRFVSPIGFALVNVRVERGMVVTPRSRSLWRTISFARPGPQPVEVSNKLKPWPGPLPPLLSPRTSASSYGRPRSAQ